MPLVLRLGISWDLGHLQEDTALRIRWSSYKTLRHWFCVWNACPKLLSLSVLRPKLPAVLCGALMDGERSAAWSSGKFYRLFSLSLCFPFSQPEEIQFANLTVM